MGACCSDDFLFYDSTEDVDDEQEIETGGRSLNEEQEQRNRINVIDERKQKPVLHLIRIMV